MRHDDGMLLEKLSLPRGEIALPAFFPDATRGAVRSAGADDLVNCGVRGLVMNAYHLMTKPGRSVVKELGGLNRFTGWTRPILTDSGGFQVYSLIRENPRFGEITPSKIIFRTDGGVKTVITPEKCIQSQFAYGSDVMTCLDCCTHPNDPYETTKRAVDLTVRWAAKCKEEYTRLLNEKSKIGGAAAAGRPRPLLFGIIQGGNDRALRKECADALKEIGFDGYGFGGWPLDSNGALVRDILEYTASLMPDAGAKYAMGVGKPENIAACFKMGYGLFDCVLPTRDARHNRLYVLSGEGGFGDLGRDFYEYYYPLDEKYARDGRPVSEYCDCALCKNHSRAYLRHLLNTGDPTGTRLATIHNLRFYITLTEALGRARRP